MSLRLQAHFLSQAFPLTFEDARQSAMYFLAFDDEAGLFREGHDGDLVSSVEIDLSIDGKPLRIDEAGFPE